MAPTDTAASAVIELPEPKPLPEWKQKQRALAKVPRGRVMHNHSIAAFREKTGVTAITKRMINGSFERAE